MSRNPFNKIKFVAIYLLCAPLFFNPLFANQSRDQLFIEMLVMNCYKEIKFCNKALLKVHHYQKNAAINKKFSCQTRLLGLEANLIMAMNSNLKRKESKSMFEAIKKYC